LGGHSASLDDSRLQLNRRGIIPDSPLTLSLSPAGRGEGEGIPAGVYPVIDTGQE